MGSRLELRPRLLGVVCAIRTRFAAGVFGGVGNASLLRLLEAWTGVGSGLGLLGLLIAIALLRADKINYGSLWLCWFLVALGFNLASTVTLSLLSKQLPGEWNGRISMLIQYSNYTGRVTGAVWGGAGVKVGMLSYVGMQIAVVGVGAVMFSTLWRQLKAKTG